VTGGPWHIRLASVDDQAALSDFGARTFADTFAADNTPEDMAAYIAASFGVAQQRAELGDPNVWTLLAEADGVLAAYAQLRRGPAPPCVTGPGPMELVRFYVDKSWHGKGLAPTLMEAAIDRAAASGARTLWLGVWERNARAQRFYAKHGFADAGSHDFIVGTDRQTDRIMVRPLKGPSGDD
jgi:GNAT superfamily N-acetyltransferase